MSTTYGLHRALLLNCDKTVFLFGDRSRTWAEVADRVARLAGALKDLGVGKGDRVAVLMLNQDRYLELYLGTAWAGAAIVPLNIRWSAIENEDALRDCRPQILIADSTFAPMSVELARKVGAIRLAYADDVGADLPASTLNYEQLISTASPVPDAEAGDGDLAGIFYTDGTTGRSKGVMLSHRNLMGNSRNMLAERLTHEPPSAASASRPTNARAASISATTCCRCPAPGKSLNASCARRSGEAKRARSTEKDRGRKYVVGFCRSGADRL